MTTINLAAIGPDADLTEQLGPDFAEWHAICIQADSEYDDEGGAYTPECFLILSGPQPTEGHDPSRYYTAPPKADHDRLVAAMKAAGEPSDSWNDDKQWSRYSLDDLLPEQVVIFRQHGIVPAYWGVQRWVPEYHQDGIDWPSASEEEDA